MVVIPEQGKSLCEAKIGVIEGSTGSIPSLPAGEAKRDESRPPLTWNGESERWGEGTVRWSQSLVAVTPGHGGAAATTEGVRQEIIEDMSTVGIEGGAAVHASPSGLVQHQHSITVVATLVARPVEIAINSYLENTHRQDLDT